MLVDDTLPCVIWQCTPPQKVGVTMDVCGQELVRQVETPGSKSCKETAQGSPFVNYFGWLPHVHPHVKSWKPHFWSVFGTISTWLVLLMKSFGPKKGRAKMTQNARLPILGKSWPLNAMPWCWATGAGMNDDEQGCRHASYVPSTQSSSPLEPTSGSFVHRNIAVAKLVQPARFLIFRPKKQPNMFSKNALRRSSKMGCWSHKNPISHHISVLRDPIVAWWNGVHCTI